MISATVAMSDNIGPITGINNNMSGAKANNNHQPLCLISCNLLIPTVIEGTKHNKEYKNCTTLIN